MRPLKTRVRQQREMGVEAAARLLLESDRESANASQRDTFVIKIGSQKPGFHGIVRQASN